MYESGKFFVYKKHPKPSLDDIHNVTSTYTAQQDDIRNFDFNSFRTSTNFTSTTAMTRNIASSKNTNQYNYNNYQDSRKTQYQSNNFGLHFDYNSISTKDKTKKSYFEDNYSAYPPESTFQTNRNNFSINSNTTKHQKYNEYKQDTPKYNDYKQDSTKYQSKASTTNNYSSNTQRRPTNFDSGFTTSQTNTKVLRSTVNTTNAYTSNQNAYQKESTRTSYYNTDFTLGSQALTGNQQRNSTKTPQYNYDYTSSSQTTSKKQQNEIDYPSTSMKTPSFMPSQKTTSNVETKSSKYTYTTDKYNQPTQIHTSHTPSIPSTNKYNMNTNETVSKPNLTQYVRPSSTSTSKNKNESSKKIQQETYSNRVDFPVNPPQTISEKRNQINQKKLAQNTANAKKDIYEIDPDPLSKLKQPLNYVKPELHEEASHQITEQNNEIDVDINIDLNEENQEEIFDKDLDEFLEKKQNKKQELNLDENTKTQSDQNHEESNSEKFDEKTDENNDDEVNTIIDEQLQGEITQEDIQNIENINKLMKSFNADSDSEEIIVNEVEIEHDHNILNESNHENDNTTQNTNILDNRTQNDNSENKENEHKLIKPPPFNVVDLKADLFSSLFEEEEEEFIENENTPIEPLQNEEEDSEKPSLFDKLSDIQSFEDIEKQLQAFDERHPYLKKNESQGNAKDDQNIIIEEEEEDHSENTEEILKKLERDPLITQNNDEEKKNDEKTLEDALLSEENESNIEIPNNGNELINKSDIDELVDDQNNSTLDEIHSDQQQTNKNDLAIDQNNSNVDALLSDQEESIQNLSVDQKHSDKEESHEVQQNTNTEGSIDEAEKIKQIFEKIKMNYEEEDDDSNDASLADILKMNLNDSFDLEEDEEEDEAKITQQNEAPLNLKGPLKFIAESMTNNYAESNGGVTLSNEIADKILHNQLTASESS